MTGLSAFREAYLNADVQSGATAPADFNAYGAFEGRAIRYQLFWSFYQNNTYREAIHAWARVLKIDRALYKHTRNVFCPGKRLGDFWSTHLCGGRLSREASDGTDEKTALPILTDNDAIRPGIARLWRDSNWQVNKQTWSLLGAVCGDVGLQVVDDPIRERVSLRVLHPSHVKWIDHDDMGNVRSYILEEWRYNPETRDIWDKSPLIDPQKMRRLVRYNEEAEIIDGVVRYRTFRDGSLYNWRGATEDGEEYPAEWESPYPFIPVVMTQHQPCHLPWGLSEFHAMVSRVLETDDMGSGLSDQIRKAIRAPKIITGATRPDADPTPSGTGPTVGNPEVSRQEMPVLYIPNAAAHVHDSTFPLDIEAVGKHIDRLNQANEQDYPEIAMDIWAVGDTSGRALRVARQRTEAKVQERRPGYDSALVRAQEMALVIGGIRGYPGYDGYGMAAYEAGNLSHEIGHRAVFEVDPLDEIEEEQARATALSTYTKAGMPLQVSMARLGYEQDEIDFAVTEKAKADKLREQQARGVPTDASTEAPSSANQSQEV